MGLLGMLGMVMGSMERMATRMARMAPMVTDIDFECYSERAAAEHTKDHRAPVNVSCVGYSSHHLSSYGLAKIVLSKDISVGDNRLESTSLSKASRVRREQGGSLITPNKVSAEGAGSKVPFQSTKCISGRNQLKFSGATESEAK